MATTSNSLLKSMIAFGALTLAAAAFFVGSEDNKGVLSSTAGNTSAEDEAGLRPTGPGRPTKGKVVPTLADDDNVEYVEASDESLMDNTEGFDPTPNDEAGFSASPTDSTINDFDDDDENSEVVDRPIIPPSAGMPVAGQPVPTR